MELMHWQIVFQEISFSVETLNRGRHNIPLADKLMFLQEGDVKWQQTYETCKLKLAQILMVIKVMWKASYLHVVIESPDNWAYGRFSGGSIW